MHVDAVNFSKKKKIPYSAYILNQGDLIPLEIPWEYDNVFAVPKVLRHVNLLIF